MRLLALLCVVAVMAGCTPKSDSPSSDETPPPAADIMPPTAPLEGTHWVLVELNGNVFIAPDSTRLSDLTFDGTEHRVSGRAVCNRMTGAFRASGDSLSLGPLAGTRMACPGTDMTLESDLYKALGSVTRHSIEGDRLNLMAGDVVVARYMQAATP